MRVKVSLFFSPQGYAVTKGILPLINEAKDTVDISIFFLTHNKISKALVAAKDRGVKDTCNIRCYSSYKWIQQT